MAADTSENHVIPQTLTLSHTHSHHKGGRRKKKGQSAKLRQIESIKEKGRERKGVITNEGAKIGLRSLSLSSV